MRGPLAAAQTDRGEGSAVQTNPARSAEGARPQPARQGTVGEANGTLALITGGCLLLSILFFAPRLWLMRDYVPGSFQWDRAHTFLLQCEQPLRRDIERLLDHTDADRQVTIIVAPNSLFSEGQTLFAGELERLRGPLFWFLGDELSGGAGSRSDNRTAHRRRGPRG